MASQIAEVVKKEERSLPVEKGYVMDVEEIRAVLPHRFPFLLVDRILELEPGLRAVGLKNVTINEPFFQGHFPGHAVMPGVLVCEAIAQVGGVVMLTLSGNQGKLAYFGGMDKVRFRKPVLPGDTLIIKVETIRVHGPIGKIRAVASVDNHVVCEGEFTCALVSRKKDEKAGDNDVEHRNE